jgi:hypothetical protein
MADQHYPMRMIRHGDEASNSTKGKCPEAHANVRPRFGRIRDGSSGVLLWIEF